MLVIFPLNPEVTEGKGCGAPMVTLGWSGAGGPLHAKGQVKGTEPHCRSAWYLQEFFSSPFILVEG